MEMSSNMEPEIVEEFFSSIESYEERVLYDRYDLRYQPTSPRIKTDESIFMFRQVFHVFSGKNFDFENKVREFNALLVKKEYPERYECATGILGYDNPTYIVFNYGKSAGDFWTNYEKVRSILGEDLDKINQSISKLLRKSQYEMYWLVEPFTYIKNQ